MLLIHILVLILLASIAWQDFKYRGICWYLLPLLLVCLLVKSYLNDSFKVASILTNLSLVIVQVGILHVYIYFKDRAWNLHTLYLGWGDVLFSCVLAFYFSTYLFLGFQIISLVLILLGSVAFQIIGQKKHTIPMAGCQALILVFLGGLQYILDISDYEMHAYISDKIFTYGY